MIIAIGSANKAKVEAVIEVVQDYPLLAQAKIVTLAVSSEVSEQPLSMEEMIRGAKNRARKAFESTPGCSYSFGLESGLFSAPGTQTGYLESSICSVYDGKYYYTGLSCGFEVPEPILKHVLDKDMDLGQACLESGITTNGKLGAAEGLVGILTKGRIDRKTYTKQGIVTALIQLENASWYHERAE